MGISTERLRKCGLSQAGMTLVELLFAIAITILVLAPTVYFMSNAVSYFRSNQVRSSLQSDQIAATSLIKKVLSTADANTVKITADSGAPTNSHINFTVSDNSQCDINWKPNNTVVMTVTPPGRTQTLASNVTAISFAIPDNNHPDQILVTMRLSQMIDGKHTGVAVTTNELMPMRYGKPLATAATAPSAPSAGCTPSPCPVGAYNCGDTAYNNCGLACGQGTKCGAGDQCDQTTWTCKPTATGSCPPDLTKVPCGLVTPDGNGGMCQMGTYCSQPQNYCDATGTCICQPNCAGVNPADTACGVPIDSGCPGQPCGNGTKCGMATCCSGTGSCDPGDCNCSALWKNNCAPNDCNTFGGTLACDGTTCSGVPPPDPNPSGPLTCLPAASSPCSNTPVKDKCNNDCPLGTMCGPGSTCDTGTGTCVTTACLSDYTACVPGGGAGFFDVNGCTAASPCPDCASCCNGFISMVDQSGASGSNCGCFPAGNSPAGSSWSDGLGDSGGQAYTGPCCSGGNPTYNTPCTPQGVGGSQCATTATCAGGPPPPCLTDGTIMGCSGAMCQTNWSPPAGSCCTPAEYSCQIAGDPSQGIGTTNYTYCGYVPNDPTCTGTPAPQVCGGCSISNGAGGCVDDNSKCGGSQCCRSGSCIGFGTGCPSGGICGNSLGNDACGNGCGTGMDCPSGGSCIGSPLNCCSGNQGGCSYNPYCNDEGILNGDCYADPDSGEFPPGCGLQGTNVQCTGGTLDCNNHCWAPSGMNCCASSVPNAYDSFNGGPGYPSTAQCDAICNQLCQNGYNTQLFPSSSLPYCNYVSNRFNDPGCNDGMGFGVCIPQIGGIVGPGVCRNTMEQEYYCN